VNYQPLLLAAIAALIVFFAWGFLTEGWLLRKDFATSAALYRVFVACVHPISNLITMNMDKKLGLEIAASNAIGWVLARWLRNPAGNISSCSVCFV
jgi:hypothetical protein